MKKEEAQREYMIQWRWLIVNSSQDSTLGDLNKYENLVASIMAKLS